MERLSKLRQRDYQPTAKGPLDGVRILDLSRLFAGNLLTQILGDYGAEVIKIEPLDGDTLRSWKTDGVGTNWKIYARNKKSLCLDLRNPEAIELVAKLVPTAAILIESFRPGVLEKMGLFIRTGTTISEVLGNGHVEAVRLTTGDTLPADLVVFACGIEPRHFRKIDDQLATAHPRKFA